MRGDLAEREFIAFHLSGGRVLAGMNVNSWDVTDPIQALVRRATPVDLPPPGPRRPPLRRLEVAALAERPPDVVVHGGNEFAHAGPGPDSDLQLQHPA